MDSRTADCESAGRAEMPGTDLGLVELNQTTCNERHQMDDRDT
jgi:hypothetical protein